MKPWKVLSKHEKRVDSDSVELHLQVERNGVQRDKIVSGATFYGVEIGGEVMLPEHSGGSEEQLHAARSEIARLRGLVDCVTSPEPDSKFTAEQVDLRRRVIEMLRETLTATTLREQLLLVAERIDREGVAVDLLDGVDGSRASLIALAMLDGAIEETT